MNLVYFFRLFEPKIRFAPIYAITEDTNVEIIRILNNIGNIDAGSGIIAKTVANVLGTNTAVPITVNQRIIVERRFVMFVCITFTPVARTSSTCSAN